MTPGDASATGKFLVIDICDLVDTYTAQATVGDVQKGLINHKVYQTVFLFLFLGVDFLFDLN
jgi:hypothetical protein